MYLSKDHSKYNLSLQVITHKEVDKSMTSNRLVYILPSFQLNEPTKMTFKIVRECFQTGFYMSLPSESMLPGLSIQQECQEEQGMLYIHAL